MTLCKNNNFSTKEKYQLLHSVKSENTSEWCVQGIQNNQYPPLSEEHFCVVFDSIYMYIYLSSCNLIF